ncbi:hypothetical protein L2E82_35776 [Cichorium intybus]|uniref:Uncharacterized protein n=1 Tax=Cichorium intybus TaxID=13427 RepID=A0ACB9BPU4_CICIN|nr:hypothetical protein L2E82_35776 [Cichorium intybus]
MLAELRLDTMKIHLYDSLFQSRYYNVLVEEGLIHSFKTDVVELLDSIDYWNQRGIPRRETDLEFIIEACAFGSQAFANYNAITLYAHPVSYVLFGNKIPPIVL